MGDLLILPILPVLILAGFGLLILMPSPFFKGQTWVSWIGALAGIASAGVAAGSMWRAVAAPGAIIETGAGLVRIDAYGLFFSFIVLVVAFLSVLGSLRFLEREGADHGEFYALLLFAVAGMLVMVQTTHLMMVLLGLEVFSLSLYVLCGLTRTRVRSVESALKYFFLGAFSSGFLVYGLALLYGAAGSLDMAHIGDAMAASPGPMLWIGMGLVLVGFSFKIAVVPFHHWVPDVYQGAPTNVTGFMAAATKTVAFAALLRFLVGAFGPQAATWRPLIAVLAILTMSVANVVALAQTNVKRLLAFSSISHAGYLLIAVVCIPDLGVQAILFYLLTYAFMTVGAFAVAAAVGRGDARAESAYDLGSWAGLARRQPVLASAMTVFLLSMAGIPPTGGFLGKYLIFRAAVESHQYLLAVVGVLNAVVAAYYYLKVVIAMFMHEPEEPVEARPVPASMTALLAVSTAAIFWLGLVPGPVVDLLRGIASRLV